MKQYHTTKYMVSFTAPTTYYFIQTVPSVICCRATCRSWWLYSHSWTPHSYQELLKKTVKTTTC